MAECNIGKVIWGEISVQHEGEMKSFKDCRIVPVGNGNDVVEWNWKLDGTRHSPGITVEAVETLLEACEYIVLGVGFESKLKVHANTIAAIEKKNIPYCISATPEAVIKFNELIQEQILVGGLFHSTC